MCEADCQPLPFSFEVERGSQAEPLEHVDGAAVDGDGDRRCDVRGDPDCPVNLDGEPYGRVLGRHGRREPFIAEVAEEDSAGRAEGRNAAQCGVDLVGLDRGARGLPRA